MVQLAYTTCLHHQENPTKSTEQFHKCLLQELSCVVLRTIYKASPGLATCCLQSCTEIGNGQRHAARRVTVGVFSPVTPARVGTRWHASSVQVGVHCEAWRASLHQPLVRSTLPKTDELCWRFSRRSKHVSLHTVPPRNAYISEPFIHEHSNPSISCARPYQELPMNGNDIMFLRGRDNPDISHRVCRAYNCSQPHLTRARQQKGQTASPDNATCCAL